MSEQFRMRVSECNMSECEPMNVLECECVSKDASEWNASEWVSGMRVSECIAAGWVRAHEWVSECDASECEPMNELDTTNQVDKDVV